MSTRSDARRLVLKIGTSSLTYPNGKLNIRCIEHLVRVISDLHNRGFELVLVRPVRSVSVSTSSASSIARVICA